SGRGLKTLLRRGFDLPNIDNPLVHQPKYFVCGQGQDPKHQTGHHLRRSTNPYHPPSEFIFEPPVDSFDAAPLLKSLRFVRRKYSLFNSPIVVVDERLMTE